MGCSGSKRKVIMTMICNEEGAVPMPIVHPFPIPGKAEFIGMSTTETSRQLLPGGTRVRITAMGDEEIKFGNGKWVWLDKLGLQASTQSFGQLELDPGFGRVPGAKTSVRPSFKKGTVIVFEIGESSPTKIIPRQSGTYGRQGSDLDVKNWTATTT